MLCDDYKVIENVPCCSIGTLPVVGRNNIVVLLLKTQSQPRPPPPSPSMVIRHPKICTPVLQYNYQVARATYEAQFALI